MLLHKLVCLGAFDVRADEILINVKIEGNVRESPRNKAFAENLLDAGGIDLLLDEGRSGFAHRVKV